MAQQHAILRHWQANICLEWKFFQCTLERDTVCMTWIVFSSLCVYQRWNVRRCIFNAEKRCQFAGRYISVWKCEFLIQHNIHWITIIYGSPIEFMETVNICKLFVMLLRHHGKHYGWIVRRIFESAMGRQDSTNKRDKWKMYNVYTR